MCHVVILASCPLTYGFMLLVMPCHVFTCHLTFSSLFPCHVMLCRVKCVASDWSCGRRTLVEFVQSLVGAAVQAGRNIQTIHNNLLICAKSLLLSSASFLPGCKGSRESLPRRNQHASIHFDHVWCGNMRRFLFSCSRMGAPMRRFPAHGSEPMQSKR